LNTGKKGIGECDSCQGKGWRYVREGFGHPIKEDPPVNFPEWFSIVKKELCHRRGINGLKGIFETGAIRPNDGSFPDTYPQSRVSYARIHNLVALFDFENATKEQLLEQMDNWFKFFFDRKPVTIAIMLSRKFLSKKLISYKVAAKERGKQYHQTIIPHVEAFYPEPIPCEVITGYLIICAVDESIYKYLPHKGAFPRIFDRIDEFVKIHNKVYQEYKQSEWREFEKALNKAKGD
jgi:hypothetical protein